MLQITLPYISYNPRVIYTLVSESVYGAEKQATSGKQW